MRGTGDGDIASQGITKAKRSMKKCEACRARKIACTPKDREWSDNLKEPCDNCYKLDLPCGRSVRSNAKIKSGPRKLASKDILEVSAAPTHEGASRSNVSGIHRTSLPELNSQAQAVHPTQTSEPEAIHRATPFEDQNLHGGIALQMTRTEQNYRIYGAAGNSQTTYDSTPTRTWTGTAPSAPAMLVRPSSVSSYVHYPNSVQSRSTRMDDVPRQLGGPLLNELRSQNEFRSFENAHFPLATLDQSRILDVNSRFPGVECTSLSSRTSIDVDPSAACGLVPLQSDRTFRVLELFPGHRSAPLKAYLTEVGFGSTYEALSFVWDDASSITAGVDEANDITVNGAAIPLNLANALRALRYTDKSRLLWIDILCINQTDVVEKSAQTTRMGEIYHGAKNVCIWLGPESRTSHLAFELINQSTDLEKFEKLVRSSSLVSYWDSFTELMRRPWFRRRWSIQEIALAKDIVVHCGNFQIGWKHFKQTVALFSTKYSPLKGHHHSITERLLDAYHDVTQLDANRLVQTVDEVVRKSDGGNILQYIQPLESLVFKCACFESRDPRDAIYALLGLSNAGKSGEQLRKSTLQATGDEPTSRRLGEEVYTPESLGDFDRRRGRPDINTNLRTPRSAFDAIKIDYTKTVFEVCRDFLMCAVEHSRSLDIICRPWAPSGQDLPSWIPTVSGNSYVIGKDAFYRRAHADPLVGYPSLDGLAVYNAAQETGPAYHYDVVNTPRELRMAGFICGEVISKRMPAMAGTIPSLWFDLKEWLGMAEDSKTHFWRTLVADRGPGSPYPAPSYYALAWEYVCEQRDGEGNLNTADIRAVEEETSVVNEFLARVQSVVWGRRLFLAAVGGLKVLALGPEPMKKKDLICILYGCSVPVLLRRVDDSGQASDDPQYHLVGECYVGGMMNGEALNMMEEHAMQEMIFRLV